MLRAVLDDNVARVNAQFLEENGEYLRLHIGTVHGSTGNNDVLRLSGAVEMVGPEQAHALKHVHAAFLIIEWETGNNHSIIDLCGFGLLCGYLLCFRWANERGEENYCCKEDFGLHKIEGCQVDRR
jgi:S-ribosylhomocysteine lyase LuxS involved in autoinducer biosynthesis